LFALVTDEQEKQYRAALDILESARLRKLSTAIGLACSALALFFLGYMQDKLLPQIVAMPLLVCAGAWIWSIEWHFRADRKKAWDAANVPSGEPGVLFL
jgi:hypothetical protein